MSNRYTNISVSQYDPMSMQEIMAVPLAKQNQHDTAANALAEQQLIQVNRLAADEDMVTSEIDKIKKSTSDMSQQLIEEGFNRSFKNKFLELKRGVDEKKSATGIFGKAEAAYKGYNDNKAAVDKNKDLSQQQRAAGMSWALNNYQGVNAGDTYKSYQGATNVDVNEKAMDIASKLTPQEIASSAGMKYDEQTGMYVDGKYKTKTLPKEHIMKVVMQSMMNDEGTASFLQDAQRIGMIDDPQQYLINAATNAANIYAVNDKDNQAAYRNVPKHKMDMMIDDKKLVTDQGWGTSSVLKSTLTREYEYSIDPNDDEMFDGDNLIDIDAMESELRAQEGTGNFITGLWSDQDPVENNAKLAEMKAKQDEFRKRKGNMGLNDMSDKAAAEIMTGLTEKYAVSASSVYKPTSMENTFYAQKELIAGKNGADTYGNQYMGDIMGRRILDNETGEEWSAQEYMEEHGLDRNQFSALLKSGSWGGVAPGSPQMPFGYVVNMAGDIDDPDAEGRSITISNDRNVTEQLNDTSTLTQNMMSGKLFDVQTEEDANGNVVYKHFIVPTRAVPGPGGRPDFKFNPAVVISSKKFNSMKEAQEAAGTDPEVIIQDMETLTDYEMTQYENHTNSITQKKK